MPRQRRIETVNGYFHVVSRGSNRQPIVFDDADRSGFALRLGVVSVRYRWVLYAWCLMTNHYHLVLRIPDGGLSLGMQVLNGGFSRATSQRYGREAHLFRNRFTADPIEEELHFFRACAYVEQNPVRAGMCSTPAGYAWSSHRGHLGLDLPPVPVASGELLRYFSHDASEARAAYARFVLTGHDPVSGTVTDLSRPW
jgi:REP-associated tyrosine transposase